MTKKTIMEQLKEAQEKILAEGEIPVERRLLSYMEDNDGVWYSSIGSCSTVHIADTLERIANALESNANQTQAKSNQTQIKGKLTYSEFFKEFNKKSDYHARKSDRGGVDIVLGDKLKASLLPHTHGWYFAESGFPNDELALMAQLAATSPELRGGINNGRD